MVLQSMQQNVSGMHLYGSMSTFGLRKTALIIPVLMWDMGPAGLFGALTNVFSGLPCALPLLWAAEEVCSAKPLQQP